MKMESEDDCGGGPLGRAGDGGWRRPPEVTSDDGEEAGMGNDHGEDVSGQSLGYMVGFGNHVLFFLHWAPV